MRVLEAWEAYAICALQNLFYKKDSAHALAANAPSVIPAPPSVIPAQAGTQQAAAQGPFPSPCGRGLG